MIGIGQRGIALGDTGQGKSQLVAHLWAIHTGQRVLIDVQDHYELGPAALAEHPPPLEVDDAADIDWRHRTIRYVPRRAGDLAELDRLHAAIFAHGRVLVWCDEAEDVAPVHRVPTNVRRCVKQGRKHRLTYLAATQRPVGVERSVINQAEHAWIFRMYDPDDVDTVAKRIGLRSDELARTLREMADHEYLWHVKGDPQIRHMPPLPPAVIAATERHVINPG
jgi:hypothetical protein